MKSIRATVPAKPAKAALKRAQSKRWRERRSAAPEHAKRLDCARFSAAFRLRASPEALRAWKKKSLWHYRAGCGLLNRMETR
jgi:hypothetical protein